MAAEIDTVDLLLEDRVYARQYNRGDEKIYPLYAVVGYMGVDLS